jgi:hypothetical protein
MAAATVIHFGSDDCFRVPLLRGAGYEVHEPSSLENLKIHLLRKGEVDAVILSGVEPAFAEKAASLVRQRSAAPLILFRHPDVAVEESRFDRVFSWSMPEAQWLFETAVLVMQARVLRAQSEALRAEAEAVRIESRRQQARAESEKRRNADAGGLWKLEHFRND